MSPCSFGLSDRTIDMAKKEVGPLDLDAIMQIKKEVEYQICAVHVVIVR